MGQVIVDQYFLFENLRVKYPKVLNNRHIFNILISNNGKSIPAISFNSLKTKVGEYLLNFKEKLNVIGTLKYNYFNNKKTVSTYYFRFNFIVNDLDIRLFLQ